MLCAAADTSDNFNYISVVIGVSQDLIRLHRRLDRSDIHMRKLSKKNKGRIINNFKCSGDVFAICLKIDRSSTVNYLYNRLKTQKHKKYVEDQFDFVFRDILRHSCESFLHSHKLAFEEITFEIDNDLRRSFSHLGINHISPKIIHQIADLVAHCNSAKRDLENVHERDVSLEIRDKLVRRTKV